MGEDAGGLAPFDRAELVSVITTACDGADLAVMITLPDTNPPRNLFLNRGAEKLLGCTEAEFQAKSVWDWITPEEAARVQAMRQRYQAEGIPAPRPFETTIIGGAGKHIEVEVLQSRVPFKGRTLSVAFLFDISARKATELALRQSEARFRALIDGAPDGVAILRGSSIAFLNAAAARMLGAESADAALGKPITSFLHPDDAALAATHIGQLHGGARLPEPAEYRSRSRDGQDLFVEISAIPTEYQGDPAVLAFARDITERKAIQARMVEADRLAALGVLSAGIAHEINNPLAYLLLNLEFLSRELPTLPEDPHKLDALMVRVKDACHGAERVASIVRDLRTFVRADEDVRGPVDVRAALEAALNIAGNEIKQKAKLIRDYEPIPPVDANPNRIEQVLLNLLLNAVQSLPSETEGQEVRARLRSSNGQVSIVIEDSGSGIPENLLGKIFDPFFTTKPVGVGTGLGLPICRSIVRGLGGEISVRSVVGQGSQFTVTLPASSAPLSERPSQRRAASEPAPRRGRILIVDDEISVARTLKALFQNEHDMTLAASGVQALAAISAETGQGFDVIMCDLMMPGMSGMDLFERIKLEHRGLERRMVFMTGGVSMDRAREFLATCPNLTFEKPFDFDHLRLTLRRLVEIAQRQQG